MRHRASEDFWTALEALPASVRDLAAKTFQQLKENPRHPSLRFKKVGPYWSARIGAHHRALAVERDYGFLWFWIGSHAEYDRLIRR